MVHFYNKQRHLVMLLSDFAINSEEEPVLSFNVEISYAGFTYSSSITGFKYLFDLFKTELVELNERKRNTASLVLTERQLGIDFE